jgi:RNA polymerase sigma-70 factor, ECF subfamily
MLETRITLLGRVRNLGDGRSWHDFHAIYHPLIFGYLRGWGIKEHDANDLTQEVFLRLIAILPSFELDRGSGRFRSYLWKMTYNALVAKTRWKKVRDGAEEEWRRRFCQAESRRLAGIIDPEPRRPVLEVVLPRARANASPTAWKCFEGRVVHGRPVAEIAAELGIAANTVSARSSEVMRDVRRLCAEIEGGHDDGCDLDPSRLR